MNQLSKKLKYLRANKEIGQDVLAKFLNLSIGAISSYENGRNEPDLETLCRIADFYGVSTDYLLGRSSCPRSADCMTLTVYGNYTFARFAWLLNHLSEKDRFFLAYWFRRLEKLTLTKKDS